MDLGREQHRIGEGRHAKSVTLAPLSAKVNNFATMSIARCCHALNLEEDLEA